MCFGIPDRWTEGWMDGLTEKLIRCGLGNLIGSSTPDAHGLKELFSTVLDRFLQTIHALCVYCKNLVSNTHKQ
jgi:hypothetical protein